MTRKITVVTVGRSDYGLYRPLLKEMQRDPDIELGLIVGDAHLSAESGKSISAIIRDDFRVDRIIHCAPASDTPVAIAQAMARGVSGCAEALLSSRPDILLVLGDRFEMFAAASAAFSMLVPIAHIHGGEVTWGAIDEGFRHAITKLSHLHFASSSQAVQRIAQMGEESWRITLSGAPGLDNMQSINWHSLADLEEATGLPFPQPPVLVTYHPATLQYLDTRQHIANLLAALESIERPIVFTAPNVDMSSACIHQAIEKFTETRPHTQLVRNLGTDRYFSLMKHSAVMVGNSSSGLIEAPSFELPVVNIGHRQGGRLRGQNVVDSGYETGEISKAIDLALSPDFIASLRGMLNPYGDGHATERILDRLKSVKLDDRLMSKRFADHPDFDKNGKAVVYGNVHSPRTATANIATPNAAIMEEQEILP